MRIGRYQLGFDKRPSLPSWKAAIISLLAIILALALFSFIFILAGYIWRTIPFVVTAGVLLLISTKWFRLRWGTEKPEALGKPYVKD